LNFLSSERLLGRLRLNVVSEVVVPLWASKQA
jgi:hypothetical protein